MIVHYLQTVNPPILPCLQSYKRTVNDCDKIKEYDCWFYPNINELINYGQTNQLSLSELLAGFFKFYAHEHDFQNDIISIRIGGIIKRKDKVWTESGKKDFHLLSVEDPFEITHDLGL
jgi:DNA polymerase sigma